jgi:hypothetical protein
MNYDISDKKYLAMCCNWIKQAKTHLLRRDSCFIFSKKPPSKALESFVGEDSRFRFCVRDGLKDTRGIFFPICGTHSEGYNLTYKLYVICNLDFPFIFMDADAIMVDSIQEIEPLFHEKPAIFIDHEPDIEGHTVGFPPFINSGVFMVNDPSKLLINWDKLLGHAFKCGFNCRFKENGAYIPGTDQSVLKSYFDSIGYQYRHEKFGVHYNTCAERVRAFKGPLGWRAVNHEGDPVKIIHYWGPFKPWAVDCPIFKELINDEMFCCDDVLDQTRKCEQNN